MKKIGKRRFKKNSIDVDKGILEGKNNDVKKKQLKKMERGSRAREHTKDDT